jgi:hypothetical protein
MSTNSDSPFSVSAATLTIRVRWAVIFSVIAIIGGGGWGAMLKDVSAENGADVKKLQEENSREHDQFRRAGEQRDKAIDAIKLAVEQIRMNFIQDRASREAHRVTDDIKSPVIRSREYDRILRENERRLLANQPPCYTLQCGG